MQSATIQLLSAIDGSNEWIDLSSQMTEILSRMGITVTRGNVIAAHCDKKY